LWEKYEAQIPADAAERSGWLWQRAESLAENQHGGLDHHNTRRYRAAMMNWQILCFASSAMLGLWYVAVAQ
jgi:hypothetical protein